MFTNRPSFSEDFVETFMDGPCVVLLGSSAAATAATMSGGGMVVFVEDRADTLALPHRPTFGNVLILFDSRLRRAIRTEADVAFARSHFFNQFSYANNDEPPPDVDVRCANDGSVVISVRWPSGGKGPANGAPWNGIEGAQIERVSRGLQSCFDRLYAAY